MELLTASPRQNDQMKASLECWPSANFDFPFFVFKIGDETLLRSGQRSAMFNLNGFISMFNNADIPQSEHLTVMVFVICRHNTLRGQNLFGDVNMTLARRALHPPRFCAILVDKIPDICHWLILNTGVFPSTANYHVS
jgi:hypothetical protein